MHVRRTLAALLAVLTALAGSGLLSACGGGGSSAADPPVSSPPTSSAPTTPPAHESPRHFIQRWAEEDTAIQQGADTTLFRQMSRGCEGCTKLANLVEHIYRAGGFIKTSGWQVRRISISKSGVADLYVFAPATTYSKSKGGDVHYLPAGAAHFQLTLKPKGESWIVVSLVQVNS